MPDIPDKVIKQADQLGREAFEAAGVLPSWTARVKAYDQAQGAHIAAWARSQERDQIRKVISEFQDRAYTPDGDYIDVPYWEVAFDLVGHLEDRLPPLDREEDQ